MKVGELRDGLQKLEKDDLVRILVEVYKKIPKKVKEAQEIDEIIFNLGHKVEKIEIEIPPRPAAVLLSISKLFYQNAMAQNYLAPNRIIPKERRKNWRFEVRELVIELQKVPMFGEENEEALKALTLIYIALAYGTGHYQFATTAVFRAIKIPQTSFFDHLCQRIFVDGVSETKFERAYEIILDNLTDESTGKMALVETLLKYVTNNEKALALLKKMFTKLKENPPSKKGYDARSQKYRHDEKINLTVRAILECYIIVDNPSAGIKFFNTNYCKTDKEIVKYCLYHILDKNGLHNEMIADFEANVDKIEFRESILDRYQELINAQAFGGKIDN